MTSLSRVSLLAAAVAVGSFFGTSAQAMTASAMPAVNNVVKPLQAVGYRRGYYPGGYARRGYYGGCYARRGYYGPGRRYGYYPYHRRYYGEFIRPMVMATAAIPAMPMAAIQPMATILAITILPIR